MAKGQKTGGRQKGTPNKVTRAVRELVVEALDDVGGKDWLIKLAKEDPKTFSGLIGRVIPTQIEGQLDTSVTFNTVYETKK